MPDISWNIGDNYALGDPGLYIGFFRQAAAPQWAVFMQLGGWVDVTAYVIDADWKLGMNVADQLLADETQITLVLRNDDGRFSPENSSGAYYPDFTPQTAVKIECTLGGVTVGMVTGNINSIIVDPLGTQTRRATVTAAGVKQFFDQSRVRMALQENKRTDQIITALIDDVIIPGEGWLIQVAGRGEIGQTAVMGGPTLETNLQQGKEVLAFAGDTFTDQTSVYEAVFQVIAAERGKGYFDRDGVFVFWNRNTVQELPAASATFDNTMAGMAYDYGGAMRNEIVVSATPRTVAAGTAVLWELEETLEVPPQGEETVRARYGDATNDTTVGGKDVVTPNTGDASLSASPQTVSVSMDADARYAELTLTNSGNNTATVSILEVRGKKLSSENRYEVIKRDETSINTYGRRTLFIDTSLLDDAEIAGYIADFELAKRKDPTGTIASLSFQGRVDNTTLHHAIARAVGDVITVTEDATSHSNDHLIIGERHRLTNGLKQHNVSWVLEPVSRLQGWRIEIAGRGEIQQTTYLGL